MHRRLDGSGDVGLENSLQLDASGNPVVSYFDRANGGLKLARCDDPLCVPDNDIDGDRVLDRFDNCPGVANADQADADADGRGDGCDDDARRQPPPTCTPGNPQHRSGVLTATWSAAAVVESRIAAAVLATGVLLVAVGRRRWSGTTLPSRDRNRLAPRRRRRSPTSRSTVGSGSGWS